MDELIKKAQKFLEKNYGINEIELSDTLGNRVRIVRNAPTVISNPSPCYQNPYMYNPNY